MDTETIEKFQEISGICGWGVYDRKSGRLTHCSPIGEEEALLGMSEISQREFEEMRKKIWGCWSNEPKHAHWNFCHEGFVYMRTRPTRGSEFFLKIPSDLVMKTVVLGEMSPSPLNEQMSDETKKLLRLKAMRMILNMNLRNFIQGSDNVDLTADWIG